MRSTIDCGGYYVVDDSVYASTLVADFELLCDQAYKVPLVESIFFIGGLLGAPAFGYAADYFGRKKALLAGLICMGRDSIGNWSIHPLFFYCYFFTTNRPFLCKFLCTRISIDPL